MDWDEELKRQAAISALLAPPEGDDSGDSYAASMAPEVVQPDDTSDYHKLVHSSFDTKTDEQVVAQPDTVYPTIAQDQGQPDKLDTVADQQVVAPAPDKLAQVERGELIKAPDLGERGAPLDTKVDEQVVDTPVDAQGRPLDEKPVQAPLGKGEAPAQLTQVERGEELTEPWHPAAKPNVPGIIAGSDNAILNPAAGVTPPTPVVPSKYPDQIVTPDEASGAKSVVNAPAAAPAASPTTVKGGEGFWGGDLTQGPPGSKPNGSEDEPYWPKSDKDIALLPPGANYIDPKDQSQKVTPGAPATVASVDQPKVAPPAATGPVSKPSLDDFNTWLQPDGTPVGPPKSTATALPTVNPDGTPMPEKMMAPNGQEPVAIIFHHTSGGGGPDGVRSTLVERGLGVQLIVDRQGNIVQGGGDGHSQTKSGDGPYGKPAGRGLSNSNTIGVEFIAQNNADINDAQKAAAQRLAAMYPNADIKGHGEINSDKEADEGAATKAAALAYRAGQPQVTSTGEPGTTPINTLVALDRSGLDVTHFGYQGDQDLDSESKAGHGKYVHDMTPGYDVALNRAAWELVGRPEPGSVFNYAGREWRYGDKVPEKYTDARFDIYDQSGTALTGAMPVGRAIAAAPAGPEKQPWDDWVTLSPEDQAAMEAGRTTKQRAILADMQEKAPNQAAFMRTLEKPMPGISDEVRQSVAAEYKKQITAYAQDYYKESDPNKAYAKIMGNADAGTFFGEIATKLVPNFMHAGLSMAQQATSANPLMQFINVAQPDASPEARLALVNKVMAQSGDDRTQFIKALYSHLGSDQAQNVDLNALLNWSDTVAQPGVQAEQARQQQAIQDAIVQNRKNLKVDPTLEGTLGGTVASAIAQFPKNAAEALVPVVGQSAMFSEIYSDTLDGLRHDHADWSEDKLKATAAAASIPQDLLQELINLGTLGVGGGALKGISNPMARIATSAILHGTVTAGAGVVQQGVTNWATGKKDITQGMLEAGEAAGVQGLIGGAIGGARHGPDLAPERLPEAEPVPVAPAEPVKPESAAPPPSPVRAGDILGPDVPDTSEPWFRPGPIVTRDVERTAFSPEELQTAVANLGDRFTPDQMQRILANLQPGYEEALASGSFSSLRNKFQDVHFGAEHNVPVDPVTKQPIPVTKEPLEVETTRQRQANLPPSPSDAPPTPAHAAVYQDLVQSGMREARARNFVSKALGSTEAEILADVQRQMRGDPPPQSVPSAVYKARIDAATKARATTQEGQPPPPPTRINESEPWVSRLANEHTVDRMASGELGHVEPGTGVSTEQMLARGLRMGPEEINQHVSDINNNRGGDPVAQAAAIRAEEARLSQRSREASLASEAAPQDAQLAQTADDAFKDLTDFHNGPVAKLKNNWHKMGQGLQGELPVDLFSYNGLREAYLRDVGKAPPAKAESVMKDTAQRVRKTRDAEVTSMNNLGNEVVKESSRRRLPTHEQVKENIAKRMRGEFPCPA